MQSQCSWTLLQLTIIMNLIVKSTDTPFTHFMQRIKDCLPAISHFLLWITDFFLFLPHYGIVFGAVQ